MKRLQKVNNGRHISGVCAGLGEYFNIDATIFRLIFAVLTVIGGAGIPLYIAAALIMPQEMTDTVK